MRAIDITDDLRIRALLEHALKRHTASAQGALPRARQEEQLALAGGSSVGRAADKPTRGRATRISARTQHLSRRAAGNNSATVFEGFVASM